MSKRAELGEFIGRLPGPLVKTVLVLIKHVLKPLAKNILLSLGSAEVLKRQHVWIRNNNINIFK